MSFTSIVLNCEHLVFPSHFVVIEVEHITWDISLYGLCRQYCSFISFFLQLSRVSEESGSKTFPASKSEQHLKSYLRGEK